MTTAYTSLLGLALPVTGELSGTWGDTVNNSITSLLDTAVAGTTTLSADTTLTTTTGAANQARQAILLCTGHSANITITAPAQSKIYTVINASATYTVKIRGVGPTTGITIPVSSTATVAWNGSDFVDASNYVNGNKVINGNLTVNGNTTLGDASGDTITINGTTTFSNVNPTLTAGTANGVAYLNGSKALTTGSALTFDGTNLGVGASSPAKRLDVRQSYTTDTVVAQIGNTNNGNGATPVATIFDFTEANGTPVSRISSIYTQSTGKTDLVFGTYNSGLAEKMRLDSSGSLGLGVTPSAWDIYKAFQVTNASLWGAVNNAYVSANLYYQNSGGRKYIANGYATEYGQASGVHSWSIAPSGTAGNAITFTQAMTLDASGNLGVGQTSPAKKLDVYLGTTGTVGQYLRNNTINLLSQIDGTNAAQFGTETSHPLVFLTANTERARIDSSGNLLVGTTSAGGYKFNVTAGNSYAGYFACTSSNIPLTCLITSGSGSQTFATFYNGATNTGYINTTGSNTLYTSVSDYRLKENVQPMTGALAIVSALKPCTYTWKADGSNGQGFIAHELQAVVPDCVTGEKDAVDENGNPVYQGIDTSFLVATLTAAIQEQQSIIQSLTDRISALEGAKA